MSYRGPLDPAGPEHLEPWEVFRQEKDGDPMVHGGNVMAPDANLATHYAREFFARRGESTQLWVIRRADIEEVADPDFLQPPLDRSFKKSGGYVMRDKLAAVRAKAGTTKPKAGTTKPKAGTTKPGTRSGPSSGRSAEP